MTHSTNDYSELDIVLSDEDIDRMYDDYCNEAYESGLSTWMHPKL